MNQLIFRSDRVAIFGSRGMAGSAISRALTSANYNIQLKPSRQELDLLDPLAVHHWFESNAPSVVILAAAKVGGIYANALSSGDYILDNLKIQLNVIESSRKSSVRRLLFLGCSCIYPKFAEQPIREEALLSGPLEHSSDSFAVAKIAGIKLCEALRRQYGFDAISLIPANLYGPGDNYHKQNSHVLAAMIRRFHEAAEANLNSVTCWGTGMPMREFLHVDDLGLACIFALENWQPTPQELPFLNVGSGSSIMIRDLADVVATITHFKGKIYWDSTKIDGSPRKQLDVSRLAKLGWKSQIPLHQGLESTLVLFRNKFSDQLSH